MTNAPLGGEATGPNPTDRGKGGTKRSLLTKEHGIPIGIAVAGANRHDSKLVDATLRTLVVARPTPTSATPQHLCLDKGYDAATVRQLIAVWGYTAHIPPGAKTSPTSSRSPAIGPDVGWPSSRTRG
jgi:transposase